MGSVLHESLTDQQDVDERIKAAGAAFGALKNTLSCKTVPLSSKRKMYETVVTGILLHGAESWTLTKKLEARLLSFHNACVRRMCRVNRWHTRQFTISQADLEKRMGMTSIAVKIRRKQLRWAGHVARMEGSRLPRQLISGWVVNPRARGRPLQCYGHALAKHLKAAGIDKKTWHQLAMDRTAWRSVI